MGETHGQTDEGEAMKPCTLGKRHKWEFVKSITSQKVHLGARAPRSSCRCGAFIGASAARRSWEMRDEYRTIQNPVGRRPGLRR